MINLDFVIFLNFISGLGPSCMKCLKLCLYSRLTSHDEAFILDVLYYTILEAVALFFKTTGVVE